jgi:tetratricopeptide (TPR) repeat protein
MNTLNKVLVIILAFAVSACMPSFIPLKFSRSDDRSVDKWLADKQYGRAIKALEEKNRNEPSQRNKMRLLEARTAASRYEKSTLAKARRKVRAGKWQSAFLILDEAIQNYPESKRLNRYRERISRRQSKGIKQARIKLVSAKATFLLKVIPIYRELNRLDPTDLDIKWKLEKTELEINETAKSLSVSGAHAVKQNDFETAQQYLELADQLNPTSANTRALANLAQLRLQRLNQKRMAKLKKLNQQRAMTARQKAQRIKLKTIAQSLRLALRRANYDRANKLLSEAQGIDPDHPEIARLRLDLDKSINAKVHQLVHVGNELYSKGRIEAARVSWKKALKLDPKNSQIRSSVERADRVLAKLREIKKQKIH